MSSHVASIGQLKELQRRKRKQSGVRLAYNGSKYSLQQAVAHHGQEAHALGRPVPVTAQVATSQSRDLLEVQFERMLKKKFDDRVRQIETVKSFKDLQTNYSGLISTEQDSAAPVKLIGVSEQQQV